MAVEDVEQATTGGMDASEPVSLNRVHYATSDPNEAREFLDQAYGVGLKVSSSPAGPLGDL